MRVRWPLFVGSLTDGYCKWRGSPWHARFSSLSILLQDALGIKMQWIFDASLACFSFWTHSSTVSGSSFLNEVTFSFSTASSPEWSNKTVFATLRIINLLAHIRLDGATEDSIFEVSNGLKRIATASAGVFKAAAGQLVSRAAGWGAEGNLLLDGPNCPSLDGNLWGRLAEESTVCRRNEESFHLLWA